MTASQWPFFAFSVHFLQFQSIFFAPSVQNFSLIFKIWKCRSDLLKIIKIEKIRFFLGVIAHTTSSNRSKRVRISDSHHQHIQWRNFRRSSLPLESQMTVPRGPNASFYVCSVLCALHLSILQWNVKLFPVGQMHFLGTVQSPGCPVYGISTQEQQFNPSSLIFLHQFWHLIY